MVNGLIKFGYQTLYLEERMCYLHPIQNLRVPYTISFTHVKYRKSKELSTTNGD